MGGQQNKKKVGLLIINFIVNQLKWDHKVNEVGSQPWIEFVRLLQYFFQISRK